MKRAILLGMLALALPSAGCSTLSLFDSAGSSTEPPAVKQAQLPSKPASASDAEVMIFFKQAQDARASGDMNTAAKILAQLVLIAPDSPKVVGEYGKVLAAQGRSDDALAFLGRAIQLAPGDWTLYSAQGVAFDQESKYLAAQASYSRALDLKPGEPAILNNAALSHMQAGDLAGAENLLRQVSAQSPDYARITKSIALLEKLKADSPATAGQPQRMGARDAMPEPVAMLAPVPAPVAKADLASAVQMPDLLPVEPSPPVEQPKTAVIQSAPPSLPMAQPKPVAQQIPSAPAKPMSAYEALKADPTVVMAPLPVDSGPQNTPRPLPKPPLPAIQPAVAQQSNDARPAGPTGKFYVQVGAYLSDARAHQAATGLEAMDVKIMQATVNGRDMFRVRIGPFDSMSAAKSASAEAQSLGHSDLFIVKD